MQNRKRWWIKQEKLELIINNIKKNLSESEKKNSKKNYKFNDISLKVSMTRPWIESSLLIAFVIWKLNSLKMHRFYLKDQLSF